MTTEPARQPHRPSRRPEIVQAAVRTFARHSYGGATVTDIAEEAGVVPAAVYYHFETKEDVLVEAVQTIGDAISAVTAEAASRPHDSSYDELADVVARVFEWADAHPDEAQLFYLWSRGVSPAVEEVRSSFVDRHVAGTHRYLQQPRGKKAAAATDLARLAAIETAVATSVAWLSEDVFPPATSRDEVADALIRVMARMLELSSD